MRRRRLVRVRHRVVFGTLEAVNAVLAPLGCQINTAFIERLNLALRQHVAAIGRRVATLCKGEDGLRQQLALFQTYHNFCLPHTSLREPLPRPLFEGEVFHKVLRMHTLFPQLPQLLSARPSCGFRQRHSKLADLFQQRGYHRPGFRHQAPRRQGVLAQQRHQQPHPALAKHAHEPQAGRPPRPQARRAHARHVDAGC